VPGRVLAIDFGLKRLGIAVSDPLGIIAQGLETIERKNLTTDLAAIAARVEDYSATEVVLGYPLSKNGTENEMSRRVAEFAEKLRQRVSCEVKLWDERLTSAEADRMLRASGIGREKRQRAVDRVAATLILQGYLDARANQKNQATNPGAET
jgi:putative Holliday junction resolvase